MPIDKSSVGGGYTLISPTLPGSFWCVSSAVEAQMRFALKGKLMSGNNRSWLNVVLIVVALPALSWPKELSKQQPSSPPGVAGDLSEELPEMEEVTPAAREALREAKTTVYGPRRSGFGAGYSFSYAPTVVEAVNSKTAVGGQSVKVSIITYTDMP